MHDIAGRYARQNLEVPMALWGQRSGQGNQTIFDVQDISEIPRHYSTAGRADALDVPAIEEEQEKRLRKGQDLIGIIHLHPPALSEGLHGRFSTGSSGGYGDFENTVELAFKDAVGRAENQQFLTGVITWGEEMNAPRIGFYSFNHQDGNTLWGRTQRIQGRVERLPGYYVQGYSGEEGEQIIFAHSFDPFDKQYEMVAKKQKETWVSATLASRIQTKVKIETATDEPDIDDLEYQHQIGEKLAELSKTRSRKKEERARPKKKRRGS